MVCSFQKVLNAKVLIMVVSGTYQSDELSVLDLTMKTYHLNADCTIRVF